MVVVRDAVHGSVELNAFEERLLDSATMQRLRFVKQLATAYLVFPSAQHSRFEHSIGTFHLTSQLCRKLGVEKGRAQVLRACALLHDVGHGAFSHLSEPLLKKYLKKSHEELAVVRLKNGDLVGVIEKNGLSFKELTRVLLSKTSGDSALISGDLGTDRMDYLLRDAFFCGVSYSLVDSQRLLDTLEFYKGELVVGQKGRLAAESLLVSRYLMFNSVYFHHAVRISYAMLSKALEFALREEVIAVEDVALGTDAELMLELVNSQNPIARLLFSRKLFKRAFSLDASAFGCNWSSKRVEMELSRSLEGVCDEEEFIVSVPESPSGGIGVKVLGESGRRESLKESSKLASALESQGTTREFIVASVPEKKSAVEKACKKVFSSKP